MIREDLRYHDSAVRHDSVHPARHWPERRGAVRRIHHRRHPDVKAARWFERRDSVEGSSVAGHRDRMVARSARPWVGAHRAAAGSVGPWHSWVAPEEAGSVDQWN